MSRLVVRTALLAGVGLAGLVVAGLLLAGPAQADSGEAADAAASGLAGDLVAAVTTPAADLVGEDTSPAGQVTEVTAQVTEATEPVVEATEEATHPVAEVAEPVEPVTEHVAEPVTQVAEVTEVTDAVDAVDVEAVTEIVTGTVADTTTGLTGTAIETVDGLVQHTGELVTTTVDPGTDLPVAGILPPVVDPYLPATESVGATLLEPDGPLAPVLPIPLPVPDPAAPLVGASGQAPLAGASITTAHTDQGGVVDRDRSQVRTLEPMAWPGPGWGGLPVSTSGTPPPPAGSGPSPVDPSGFPSGALPMTGGHQHVGNPTDAGQPLCAATAATTPPVADSVCMKLPDDLAAVGLVMAIATPPG